MERVSRDGGIVAVARTNEDVCAALSDRGVDCVDVVASEGEPLTVDGDVASGKRLRVVSGDVFVLSPFESVTACDGSRVRVLACVCSGVDSDAGVIAESGAMVYAGDGVTVGAEAGSLVYAEDGSCVRLLDDGVRVFASAGALVLYGSRSELALVQGGAHVKRTLTYGVAQWLDESGVVVDDDLNVCLYAAVDGETGLWCGPYDGESAFLLPCADMWGMIGVGVEVVPVTIPVGLLHPVVAKWPRADWAVVSACVNGGVDGDVGFVEAFRVPGLV